MIKMTLEQFKDFLSNTEFTVEHSADIVGYEIYRPRNNLLIVHDYGGAIDICYENGHMTTKYTAGDIDIYYEEDFSYVEGYIGSLSIDNNRWKFSGLTLVDEENYPLHPNEYDLDEIIEQNLAIESPDYNSFDLPGLIL